MTGTPGRLAYRGAIAAALAASFLQIWVNLAVGIVGEPDNPVNQGFYGVVAAAAACAFTARLKPDAMARAMLATAGLQAVLTLAVATAPSIARVEPMGAGGVVALSAGFVGLWLASAFLFHKAVRAEGSHQQVNALTRAKLYIRNPKGERIAIASTRPAMEAGRGRHCGSSAKTRRPSSRTSAIIEAARGRREIGQVVVKRWRRSRRNGSSTVSRRAPVRRACRAAGFSKVAIYAAGRTTRSSPGAGKRRSPRPMRGSSSPSFAAPRRR